ncbi:1,4-dihydroxy-6-naphthoate synthase [Prolixibacter denitrificans]|uniref:1,4-dihydroxy-6-naphtoate synthase n=1 Tax=Prolixibacter denitrificans TaxID=1541063 RepID=A0A2P8CFS5_9BACT|nr:1,4-dihydroxy-6-naphthoate synthase [Prolixibacter denitrificans]PSK83806.1 1,4-dihydroxy-6-naphthoate synthase [Prolixibacter denitrificans]GET23348.1 1,4-dihydroxy-6-naphtoate synthase [Prolixibacter denitrificans]
MNLTLGFSTCPNDTFIFDAMVHNRVDTEGLTFETVMADVEELNRLAFAGEIDITKLSYAAYAQLTSQYVLLDAGSALGRNNGPLLISKTKIYPDEVPNLRIAIPGEHTTANLLLSVAYPNVKEKKEYLFSDIEEVVLSGEMDAGLIIHENRFTYQKRGLKKILDLGEYWEETTGSPIPLGGIVVNRNLPREVQEKVNRVMKRSVEYAYEQPDASYPFVKLYAQEMEESVMRSHIDLYVNEFTRNLGEEGKQAVRTLYRKAEELGIIPKMERSIFLD